MERKTYTITGISPRTGKRYTITTVTPHGRGSDQVTDAMKRARENGWTDVKVGVFKWGKTVEELSAAAKATADALEGNPVDPADPWDLRGGAEDEWKFLSGKLAEANAELEAQKQRTQDAYGGRMPASSHHAIQVLQENRDRWQESVDNFTEDYPNIVKGNAAPVPGGVETAADGTLHGMLSDVADHIDYEAKVVEQAADQLPDDDEVGKLAGKQADKMADAAEAVSDAADAAADTTAAVFNETGVAQHDQKDGAAGEIAEQVTGGNPMGNPTPTDRWVVNIEHPSGSTEIYSFDNEAEAVEFAEDYYTPLDTQEARDTTVSVSGPKYFEAVAGNPASEAYQAGHERGEQYEGLDPEEVPDPLSGEWAGESMPELLGSDFTDEDADDYEEGYWDAVVGNPTMTRQHFQLIADVLKRLPADQQRTVAEAFADELAATNPRFDRERFLAAAISKGNPVEAATAVETVIPEAGADSTILAEPGLPAAGEITSAVTPDVAPTPAHWYTRPLFTKGR